MSEKTGEMRTIFSMDRKGIDGLRRSRRRRKEGNHKGCPYKDAQPDDRAADRRRFFGFLSAMRPRLDRYGVSDEDVRVYYAKRFGVKGHDTHSDEDSQSDQRSGRKMSGCSQRQWAIAAAEMQAMFQSPEIFADRIVQFAEEEKNVQTKDHFHRNRIQREAAA